MSSYVTSEPGEQLLRRPAHDALNVMPERGHPRQESPGEARGAGRASSRVSAPPLRRHSAPARANQLANDTRPVSPCEVIQATAIIVSSGGAPTARTTGQ